jgi:hypothetical protein
VGLDAAATAADAFVVRLVAPGGSPLATALTVSGDGTNHAPHWQELTYHLPGALAGQNVAIELVAKGAGADSTVEAGVDQVRVTAP